jgi:gliding motility-associated lipoprotein GldH
MQERIQERDGETNLQDHPILLQQAMRLLKEVLVATPDASATMAEGGVKAFLALATCFALSACEQGQVAQSSFVEFPATQWHADSVVQFQYEHAGAPELFELAMHLQHDASYPYANLFLFRKVLIDGDVQFSDTVQITLADAYGNWNGEGIGSVKTLDLPYRKQYLRMEAEGLYTFEFQHGMRDTKLSGMRSLGLTFIRRDGQEKDQQ